MILPGFPTPLIGRAGDPVSIRGYDANNAGANISVAHEPGDLLLLVKGRVDQYPTALSGWNYVTGSSSVSQRQIWVASKTATTSGTETAAIENYGLIVALQNAGGIGQASTTASGLTTSTLPLPYLTGLDTSGRNLVLAGFYAFAGVTGIDSPYALESDVFGKIVENTAPTLASTEITLIGNAYNVTWAVEITT